MKEVAALLDLSALWPQVNLEKLEEKLVVVHVSQNLIICIIGTAFGEYVSFIYFVYLPS